VLHTASCHDAPSITFRVSSYSNQDLMTLKGSSKNHTPAPPSKASSLIRITVGIYSVPKFGSSQKNLMWWWMQWNNSREIMLHQEKCFWNCTLSGQKKCSKWSGKCFWNCTLSGQEDKVVKKKILRGPDTPAVLLIAQITYTPTANSLPCISKLVMHLPLECLWSADYELLTWSPLVLASAFQIG
jgi:hypothetical protein